MKSNTQSRNWRTAHPDGRGRCRYLSDSLATPDAICDDDRMSRSIVVACTAVTLVSLALAGSARAQNPVEIRATAPEKPAQIHIVASHSTRVDLVDAASLEGDPRESRLRQIDRAEALIGRQFWTFEHFAQRLEVARPHRAEKNMSVGCLIDAGR